MQFPAVRFGRFTEKIKVMLMKILWNGRLLRSILREMSTSWSWITAAVPAAGIPPRFAVAGITVAASGNILEKLLPGVKSRNNH
jgi:hypothetical protein